jgi:hypothetical protein
MIKRVLFFSFSFFIFHTSFSQPLVRQVDPFPVQINGSATTQPLAGGVNSPLHQFVDIDTDSDFDLVVFDNDLHIQFWRNEGTRFVHNFKLRTGAFAIPEILVWFRFIDFDGDGRIDFCKEDESANGISVYKNTGTPQLPQFTLLIPTLLDTNGVPMYAGGGSIPTFADIDADGDLDLFTANLTGSVNFYRNVGTRTQPRYAFASAFWECIIIVGDSCSAGCTNSIAATKVRQTHNTKRGVSSLHGAASYTFADIDGENDLDFFISDLFWSGVFFLRNVGRPDSAAIRCVTNSFPPGDSVSTSGFNQTSFVDIDGDNDLDMFAGVLAGIVQRNGFLFYRNLGSRTAHNLRLQTRNFLSVIDVGMNARAAFTDIDADNDQDMFIGNLNGELARFTNVGTPTAPSFTLTDSVYLNVQNGFLFSPAFVDVDNDGDKDLLAGMFDGSLKFFRNTGSPQSPQFSRVAFVTDTITVGGDAAPALVDIDNDGDKDLFIGKRSGSISFYRNTGSVTNFVPTLVTHRWLDISIVNEPKLTPAFSDFDADGDFDFFFGTQEGKLYQYENTGTPSNGQFIFRTDNFGPIAMIQDVAPTFIDIDGDTDADLFVGEKKGGTHFYRNNRIGTAVEVGSETPSETRLLQNYPNPFNPTTTFELRIADFGFVSLKIFDVMGKEIATLIHQPMRAGSYSIRWDAGNNPAGVYFCRLTTARTSHTIKLLLIK